MLAAGCTGSSGVSVIAAGLGGFGVMIFAFCSDIGFLAFRNFRRGMAFRLKTGWDLTTGCQLAVQART
ncbi:MAG: hypothetical protein BGP07_03730 [Rhizobiales bacterium 63-22]|nr:MAG: hypothetical protein BGP07_03730 [Rhizobiales bacterium 63-22]